MISIAADVHPAQSSYSTPGLWESMRTALIALILAVVAAAPVSAQNLDWNPGGLLLTRSELKTMLSQYDQVAQSSAYSGALRGQAKAEAALIKDRLENGDFHVGDQIAMVVQGEPALTDTFTVSGKDEIDLPVLGAIPMHGVLRSELDQHLTTELARYIKDPVVQARALVRISIQGQVARPGFYVFPSSTVLTSALMETGGPTPTADMDDITIERGGHTIWTSSHMQSAIREGRTLDQLSIEAGDVVDVGQKRTGISVSRVLLGALVTVPSLVYAISRIVTH